MEDQSTGERFECPAAATTIGGWAATRRRWPPPPPTGPRIPTSGWNAWRWWTDPQPRPPGPGPRERDRDQLHRSRRVAARGGRERSSGGGGHPARNPRQGAAPPGGPCPDLQLLGTALSPEALGQQGHPPRQWTSSASGHLDPGENYAASAKRELREELGLDLPLRLLGRLPPANAPTTSSWRSTWPRPGRSPCQPPRRSRRGASSGSQRPGPGQGPGPGLPQPGGRCWSSGRRRAPPRPSRPKGRREGRRGAGMRGAA